MGRSAVFLAPERIALREEPEPELGPTGVRLRVEACGVCGSDVTSFFTGHYVRPGQVMGHEAVGRVEAVGERVQGRYAVGERVMVQPVRSCGTCWYCRRADVHLCRHTGDLSLAYGLPGAYARHLMVNGADVAGRLVPLSPGVTVQDALWAEPLAVALHALGRAGIGPGTSIGIVGAGSIGLSLVAAATAGGAEVCVVEPRSVRRDLARLAGATAASAPGVAAGEFDAVVDSSGVVAGTGEALRLLRPGGTLVLVGVTDASVPIPPAVAARGAFGYRPDEFIRATRLINSGAARLGSLVTHRFGLDEIEQAFATVREDPTAGKVMVMP